MNRLKNIGFSMLLMLFFGTIASAQNVNVTATGGTANATYATMKASFDAINAGTHTGAITLEIAANTTEPANTSAVLNSSGAGAASYTSVLIRPAADNITVTGAGGTGGASCTGKGLIELNGADNVTIDGDNPNTSGINRNLSFTNTCATNSTSVIRIASSTLVNTANNLTFKNLNVNGNAVGRNTPANNSIGEPGNPTGYSYGIIAAGGASTTNAANAPATITDSSQFDSAAVANNFTVENIRVINAGRGINLKGRALTNFPNLLIRRNLIGNPNEGEVDQIYHYGITVSGSNGGVISDNTVYVESFLNTIERGIDVGFGSNVNTGGIIVERNQVRRAKGRNPNGAAGMGISIFTDFGNTVRNNFVSGVSGGNAGVFSDFVASNGIWIGRGPNHRIYHNTVLMTGDLFGAERTLSTALAFNNASGNGSDVRNNILINTQTQSGAADPSLSAFVAIYLPALRTASYNLTLNNNDYFTGTAVNNGIAQVGNAGDMPGAGFYLAANFDPNATTPATNFRAYSSTLNNSGTNDNQSKKVDPLLISATDLHISPASPMVNMGAEVGVFNDIDGQLRVGIPDIGADEPDGTAPPANDISATALVSPLNGAVLSPTVPVTPSAQFTNFGTATQTNVTVRYQIINSSNVVIYNQTATIASIAQNQVVTVTFPATTVTPAGTYTIRATVELAGDQNAANDSISGTVTVLAPVSGTINVGAGQSYTSLTNGGGLFEALNVAGASGNLVVDITSNLTTETGAIKLNELPGGASLTLKPSGAPRTISGAPPLNTALIAFSGTDNVTIDGSLNGGTDRSLTFNFISGNAGIYLAAGTNGAQNNTIKNVNIVGGSLFNISYGIFSGGNTLPSNGGPNINNRFQNNNIQSTAFGIATNGASAIVKNTGTVITQNVMTGTGANRIGAVGIYVTFDDGAQITDNTISNLESTSSADAIGIAAGIQNITSTAAIGFEVSNATITRNSISGVVNSGRFSAVGIALAASTTGTNNVFNNMISGVLSGSNANDLTAGIFVGTAAGGTQNIYYNSISMTGDRGADEMGGSFGIAVNGGNNPVNVRNNIFVNSQTNTSISATAVTYAIGIGYAAFTNLNSNNNILLSSGANSKFAITGALRNSTAGAAEYTDLIAFRTATGQDSNSLALDPKFVSATDLHIQTGVATPVENRGVPIAGITIDFDGDTRSATTPDIGADEGNFTPLTANDIAATQIVSPIPNQLIIGTPSNIVTPKAVFVNSGAATQTNVMVRFTITGPGGYNYTNTQTIASLAVGASTTVTFANAPAFTAAGTYTATATNLFADANAANDSVSATFPVLLPLSGNYNVGAGQTFTSLTNAGGIFDALIVQGVTGNIVINLTSDLTAETGAFVLNELPNGITVTIKPSGAPRTISGAAGALIKLNGADNVTIDGSLNGGTDRSLTISNTGAVIWIADSATNGANGNTVKNCVLVGGGANAAQVIFAGAGSNLGATPQFPNSNNTLHNNRISAAQNAAVIIGNATTVDQNWTITENNVGGTQATDKMRIRGFGIANSQNLTISRNKIIGVNSLPNDGSTVSGIAVFGNINGATITRNEIRDIRQTSPFVNGSNGILLSVTSAVSNITVANNFISDVAANGFAAATSDTNGYGIVIEGGSGYKIWHNSVNMNTNQTLPASITAALLVASNVAPASLDVRNNIFSNTQTVGTRYAVYVAGNAAVFSSINYNDYFAQNVGFLNAAQPTLPTWQAATGQDANSKAVDPLFVAPTNLHLQKLSPLVNMGTPLAGLTVDFDGQNRDAMPDIGADEFVPIVVGNFDGDNRTDLIVFRPTDGVWYVSQSTNGIPNAQAFGQNGDIPVPGDYDGDGRMDFAVFRPSNGFWYIQQSSNFAVIQRQFGISTDKPVQGDYDGDGKTDIAVWRPSDGFWYALRSSDGTFSAVRFGQLGDVPVQGDFSGDARTDYAVYRGGIWYVLVSSDNSLITRTFGAATDTPLVGDFDGDGKADFTVYRGGVWYILQSLTNTNRAVTFGTATDIPVVGDYDGDGTSDVAVFRPSNGVWYVINSSTGAFTGRQWGQSGDVPIPAAYQAR